MEHSRILEVEVKFDGERFTGTTVYNRHIVVVVADKEGDIAKGIKEEVFTHYNASVDVSLKKVY